MKFVDEATIKVQAGKGGDGSASFRREKYVPWGGPDGGDGGKGGSVYFVADAGMNTLVDFRYQTRFTADNGEAGGARQCSGKDGADCIIPIPLGTVIRDADTNEILGDLLKPGARLLVAQGGRRGLGNLHFKSSTNRAPRKTIPGEQGENRELNLELKLLADVGLLGLPNAGKSTFIQAVSLARPKIADYPFTTLHPQLGIVSLTGQRRFVIADIPGLVPGASQGKGLGIQFLKHLSRTRVLLHLVDLIPMDGADPADNILAIEKELASFSEDLAQKPRWLVFNKIDCFAPEEIQPLIDRIVKQLDYQGPVFAVSALNKQGVEPLCEKIMQSVLAAKAAENPEPAMVSDDENDLEGSE
jgi:GTP-binding protein